MHKFVISPLLKFYLTSSLNFLRTKVLIQSGTNLCQDQFKRYAAALQRWILSELFLFAFEERCIYLKLTYVFPLSRSTENSEAEITACCL